jgi:hypothetical protein
VGVLDELWEQFGIEDQLKIRELQGLSGNSWIGSSMTTDRTDDGNLDHETAMKRFEAPDYTA